MQQSNLKREPLKQEPLKQEPLKQEMTKPRAASPIPSQKKTKQTFVENFKESVSFGFGSALANQFVGSIFSRKKESDSEINKGKPKF